jgi:hypothetical protein
LLPLKFLGCAWFPFLRHGLLLIDVVLPARC